MTVIIVLGTACIAGIAILAIRIIGNRKHCRDGAVQAIQKQLDGQIGKHHVTGAVLLVDAPQAGIHQSFTAGNITDAGQPFHIASIGKAFTAVLTGMLIDSGKLQLDTKIKDLIDSELLSGLFVVDGTDYSAEVSVRQLLNHTSGIADYFEDPAYGAAPMQQQVLSDRDRLWKPADLLAFTRQYQRAAGKPGETFHYSDTGYILLGLMIEAVSGKSFGEMLHQNIFEPLRMNDSYLMFYTKPKHPARPIADVWLGGENIKDCNSLSIDWAGGGIVSTVEDLAAFARALADGRIISKATLAALHSFDQKYMTGIHYGCGFMRYHFGEYFFTLRTLPKGIGHMGVLGTQMVYHKPSGSVYVSSLGSASAPGSSVRMMIQVLSILQKVKK